MLQEALRMARKLVKRVTELEEAKKADREQPAENGEV